MGTTRSVVKKDSPEWLRCQTVIRKLVKQTGQDALVYAKNALEHEDSEPERLKTFWDNARRHFDDYEMKATPKPPTTRTKVQAPAAPASPPVPEAPQETAVPAPEMEKK